MWIQEVSHNADPDSDHCPNSTGADPNGGNHEHNYTALHFAGLAGKPEVPV